MVAQAWLLAMCSLAALAAQPAGYQVVNEAALQRKARAAWDALVGIRIEREYTTVEPAQGLADLDVARVQRRQYLKDKQRLLERRAVSIRLLGGPEEGAIREEDPSAALEQVEHEIATITRWVGDAGRKGSDAGFWRLQLRHLEDLRRVLLDSVELADQMNQAAAAEGEARAKLNVEAKRLKATLFGLAADTEKEAARYEKHYNLIEEHLRQRMEAPADDPGELASACGGEEWQC